MPVLDQVDHLVYATADLEKTVSDLERLLGISATPGGRHPGRGTRNALLGIGPTSYLEIVGPDEEQESSSPLWFGIGELTQARLVTWAAKASNLQQVIRRAASAGLRLGPITSGSRQRPDGVRLSWQFTEPVQDQESGILPFFIDWHDSPHPATTAVRGITMTAFRAEHPDPERVERQLRALGLNLDVEFGAVPVLIATLQTPSGEIMLR